MAHILMDGMDAATGRIDDKKKADGDCGGLPERAGSCHICFKGRKSGSAAEAL